MSLDCYEMDRLVSWKLIWPKFTRSNSRTFTNDKEVELYDPEVHMLAQLLTAGAVTRVR
jgi:predicted transcriptional regulator YdeE